MTELIAPQAAVVGGSVVAFANGVQASQREDIYMSTAFAQNATRAALQDGLVGDWFTYYRDVLRFIGWDVPKPTALTPSGTRMAGQAVQGIETVIGEAYSEPVRRALLAMERNTSALKLFEDTSLRGNVGYFQVIPCLPSGPNKVQMGIYHRQFQVRQQVSGFLFGGNPAIIHNSVEQIAVITFNTLHYAQFREKVKKSVVSGSLKYLSSLDI